MSRIIIFRSRNDPEIEFRIQVREMSQFLKRFFSIYVSLKRQ